MHCPVYNIVMIFKVEMFMRFSTRKKHIYNYIYIYPLKVLLIVIPICESSISMSWSKNWKCQYPHY